jgi:hypothetical protein
MHFPMSPKIVCFVTVNVSVVSVMLGIIFSRDIPTVSIVSVPVVMNTMTMLTITSLGAHE